VIGVGIIEKKCGKTHLHLNGTGKFESISQEQSFIINQELSIEVLSNNKLCVKTIESGINTINQRPFSLVNKYLSLKK